MKICSENDQNSVFSSNVSCCLSDDPRQVLTNTQRLMTPTRDGQRLCICREENRVVQNENRAVQKRVSKTYTLNRYN